MVTRVMQRAVWVVPIALILTGCGRQVSQESPRDRSLSATGLQRRTEPTARAVVAAAFEAAGGLAAWEQCRKIEFRATVTACEGDGCFYLTEHDFVLSPWANAIQVAAREPRASFTWQVAHGRPRGPQVDWSLDVSPLRDLSCDYADAVLQIVTAPVRMLEDPVSLKPAPTATRMAGQWYLPIDARYQARKAGPREKPAPPHWTLGIYFQSQDRSVVDALWLGNPDTRKYILVRGYDYAPDAGNSVLIPTKIEMFQSDPQAKTGPRLALIDLRR